MTRTLPRTNFHSSKLVRCLADLGMVDTVNPANGFAEKLASWVPFSDAITLSAVHNDRIATSPKLRPEARTTVHDAVNAEFSRIQAFLITSIKNSCSPRAARTHISLPAPILELPMNLAAAYTPYRRFYEAQQRDMELSIRPLRFNVRETVAKASPRLAKLAELDAVLEKILYERERQLLSKVAVLLKKRLEQLYKEHQQKLIELQQADNPAGWTQAGGWLARFCNDMQMLLLAEVELRLQPTIGLMEALKQDMQ
ncbi:MAG: hypothetical protein A3I66_10200 [Burkholderiales bacterium RIFCSPLOWO2_02_FULL_57_36]|nr:MAG: hypothetical protein A3I66_10200 [Burkholderiales bacterium RIFCSPLOWO2_02_FULL_57_36]